jgi:hypothetical protein
LFKLMGGCHAWTYLVTCVHCGHAACLCRSSAASRIWTAAGVSSCNTEIV